MGTAVSVLNPRNIPPVEKRTTIASVGDDGSSRTSSSSSRGGGGMFLPNQFKSAWMTGQDLVGHLERGDLVEIRRGGAYTHWVVYIGLFDDVPCVAHISTDAHELGTKKELRSKLLKRCGARVRSDPFLAVVGDDLSRINNSLDTQRRPFPHSVIVERTISKLGTGGYHLVQNNCEHFAKWCRYGLRESDQSIVGQAGAIGLATLAATTSFPYSLAIGAVGFAVLKAGQAMSRRYLMRSII